LLTVLSSFPCSPSSLTLGTAFTLGAANQCKSAIGKPDYVDVLSDFPLPTQDQIIEDMTACLDLNGCDITKAPGFGHMVDRPRVSAQLPFLISKHQEDWGKIADNEKQQVIDAVVATSILRTKTDLKAKLNLEMNQPHERGGTLCVFLL
jgi:hypothetical protein